jgi:hypothetical protein
MGHGAGSEYRPWGTETIRGTVHGAFWEFPRAIVQGPGVELQDPLVF